jgi:hypothetical protein
MSCRDADELLQAGVMSFKKFAAELLQDCGG